MSEGSLWHHGSAPWESRKQPDSDGVEMGDGDQNIKSDKEPQGDEDSSLLWPRTVLPALEICSLVPKKEDS